MRKKAGLSRKGFVAATSALSAAAVAGWMLKRKLQQPDFGFTGRTVLITGGSRGLGFALATEFVKQGSRVAICARNQHELDSAERRLSPLGHVMTCRCDLQERNQIRDLVRAVETKFGQIEVLINNAGVIQVGPWQTMTDADYEEAMKIHFWAPLWTTLAVLPGMLRVKEGRIVNISSIGGVVPVPHMLPYVSSKFALVGLSEAWRSELLTQGIRLTAVCPWLMRTGSQDQAFFKGQNQREFAWFALTGAMPVSSMSAERAARRIIRACARGDARVVLAVPGKLVALAHSVVPGAMVNILGLMNRLLPDPGGIHQSRQPGRESYNALTSVLVKKRIRNDGEKYNQPSVA